MRFLAGSGKPQNQILSNNLIKDGNFSSEAKKADKRPVQVDGQLLEQAEKKEEKRPTKKELVYQKKGNFPPEKQAIIAHASRISNNNLDFIATLDKENAGSWDVNKKSKKNKNGTYDKGLCQFNSGYYSHYYKLPEWNNPEWQVNRCWEEFQSAVKRGTIYTKFYAYAKRHASKLNFELREI